MSAVPYRPRIESSSHFVPVRGLRYHVRRWGPASDDDVPLVMVHGWMDVGASFQFLVDALAVLGQRRRTIHAPDWRGFGLTDGGNVDAYWFPDYLADLDALLDHLAPGGAVDLLGHSMGGNVVMTYAGVRPHRVRRLVNLEGFGLPRSAPDEAPGRLARWLDELKQDMSLRNYGNATEVADRLCANNPRLTPDKAAWLAHHWAQPRDGGRWHVLGDAAHKRINPVPYRADEAVAAWQRIEAPVLWVEADLEANAARWTPRYPRTEFEARLGTVRRLWRTVLPDCGHMLHHDQPEALAQALDAFLSPP